MSFLHLPFLFLIFSFDISSAIERDTSNLVPFIQPSIDFVQN